MRLLPAFLRTDEYELDDLKFEIASSKYLRSFTLQMFTQKLQRLQDNILDYARYKSLPYIRLRMIPSHSHWSKPHSNFLMRLIFSRNCLLKF